MFLLSRFIVCVLVVLLDFDGSFRPPRDTGYPTIPSKIAACSASISISADGTKRNNGETPLLQPFAVGCHWLPLDHEMTSAHAEYRGMILGLEFLNDGDMLSELLSKESGVTSLQGSNKSKNLSLVIRGDCKAVIDQHCGRSTPRKVESAHLAAQALCCQLLQTEFDSVAWEHVPREDNALCDSLCTNLMSVIERKELVSFAKDLTAIFLDENSSADLPCNISSHRGGKAREIMGADYLFSRYLKSEARCRIKYSLRPALYQRIAYLAASAVDYDTLVKVGERQATESAIRKDKKMLAQGIRNQIRGWSGQGNDKTASYLARKHRVLLSIFKDGHDDVSSDMIFTYSHDLVPVEKHIEWPNSIHSEWYPLMERFHTAAMAMTWQEGSRLWVR